MTDSSQWALNQLSIASRVRAMLPVDTYAAASLAAASSLAGGPQSLPILAAEMRDLWGDAAAPANAMEMATHWLAGEGEAFARLIMTETSGYLTHAEDEVKAEAALSTAVEILARVLPRRAALKVEIALTETRLLASELASELFARAWGATLCFRLVDSDMSQAVRAMIATDGVAAAVFSARHPDISADRMRLEVARVAGILYRSTLEIDVPRVPLNNVAMTTSALGSFREESLTTDALYEAIARALVEKSAGVYDTATACLRQHVTAYLLTLPPPPAKGGSTSATLH